MAVCPLIDDSSLDRSRPTLSCGLLTEGSLLSFCNAFPRLESFRVGEGDLSTGFADKLAETFKVQAIDYEEIVVLPPAAAAKSDQRCSSAF